MVVDLIAHHFVLAVFVPLGVVTAPVFSSPRPLFGALSPLMGNHCRPFFSFSFCLLSDLGFPSLII